MIFFVRLLSIFIGLSSPDSFYAMADEIHLKNGQIYKGISEKFYNHEVPWTWAKFYKPGTKIAVLGGSFRSGRGIYNSIENTEFITINYDEDENPTIVGNFLNTNSFSTLNESFDLVVIEVPGLENMWFKEMYLTAYNLLKKNGILEVSVPTRGNGLNFVPRTLKESTYIQSLLSQIALDQNLPIERLKSPDSKLIDFNGFLDVFDRDIESASAVYKMLLSTYLRNIRLFSPMYPEYSPGAYITTVLCQEVHDFVKSRTQIQHTHYCFFRK